MSAQAQQTPEDRPRAIRQEADGSAFVLRKAVSEAEQ